MKAIGIISLIALAVLSTQCKSTKSSMATENSETSASADGLKSSQVVMTVEVHEHMGNFLLVRHIVTEEKGSAFTVAISQGSNFKIEGVPDDLHFLEEERARFLLEQKSKPSEHGVVLKFVKHLDD